MAVESGHSRPRRRDRRLIALASLVPLAIVVAGVAEGLHMTPAARQLMTAAVGAAYVLFALVWLLPAPAAPTGSTPGTTSSRKRRASSIDQREPETDDRDDLPFLSSSTFMRRAEEAVAAYDEVVARFGESPQPALREQTAKALYNKAAALGSLGRAEEAVAAYDEVVARFGESPLPALREQTAKALYNKAAALGSLGRAEEAVAAYDEVVARFGESPLPALREQTAKALYNKAVAVDKEWAHELLGRAAMYACRASASRSEPARAAAEAAGLHSYSLATRARGPVAAHAARCAARLAASVGAFDDAEEFWALSRDLSWRRDVPAFGGLIRDYALVEPAHDGTWHLTVSQEEERSVRHIYGPIDDSYLITALTLDDSQQRPILGSVPTTGIGPSFAALDGHGSLLRLSGDAHAAARAIVILRELEAALRVSSWENVPELLGRLGEQLPGSVDSNELRLLVAEALRERDETRTDANSVVSWDALRVAALRIIQLFELGDAIDSLLTARRHEASAVDEADRVANCLQAHQRRRSPIVELVVRRLHDRGVASELIERIEATVGVHDEPISHDSADPFLADISAAAPETMTVDLRDSLVAVSPGLGAALTNLMYCQEHEIAASRSAMVSLVDRLWVIELDRIPEKVRRRLPRLLDCLNKHLHERASRGYAPASERRQSRQSQARALVLVRLLKRVRGKPSLGGDLKDLDRAFRALYSANIMERAPEMLDARIRDFLAATVSRIPSNVESFTQLLEGEGGTTISRRNWRFLACANAAYLLWVAGGLLRSEGRLDEARGEFERALRYFDAAHVYREGNRAQDWVRLVPSWVAAELDFIEAARIDEEEERASAIRQVTLRFAAAPPPHNVAAWHIAATRVRLIGAEAESSLDDDAYQRETEVWTDAVQKEPQNQPAWARLVEHVAYGDDRAATLVAMDDWLAAASLLSRRSRDWAQYRVASLSADLARRDDDWALEGVRRYVDVLIDQPNNDKAAVELLELSAEVDADDAGPELSRLPTSAPSLPQALVRVALLQAPPTHHRLAAAVAALLTPEASSEAHSEAHRELVRVLTDPQPGEQAFSSLLDAVIRVRMTRDAAGGCADPFETMSRLLDAALTAQFDRTWWIRRSEIAARLREVSAARRLLELLGHAELRDPTIAAHAARLELVLGRPEGARALLADTLQDARAARRDIAESVVEDRGYAMLRVGDFEEAADAYREILERHPYDATASFGLGRVAFESGDDRTAIEHWIGAVRVGSRTGAGDIGWSAARSIGALIAQPNDAAVAGQLEARLRRAIADEDPQSVTQLVDGVRYAGSVADRFVEHIMKVRGTLRVRKHVAQCLMAQLIYRAIPPDADVGAARDLAFRAVAWAQEHGVTAELLGGAKSSYGRALAAIAPSDEPGPWATGPAGLTPGEFAHYLVGTGLGTVYTRVIEQDRDNRHYYREPRSC